VVMGKPTKADVEGAGTLVRPSPRS